MEIKLPTIEGDVPDVERIRTGLWSVDRALGNKGEYGLPLRTITELYGREHCGKSSLAYYLAGSIRPTGKVGIVDTEGSLDPAYLRLAFRQAGFDGTIKVVDQIVDKGTKKGMGRYHAEQLQELADYLINPEFNGIIIDSIGAFISTPEAEGDIGDANMGKRAFNVGQWAKRCASHLSVYREPPKVVIMVNHVYQSLSSRGHYTPGGRAKGHAAGNRLYMWRKETFDDGSFLAEMKLEKLRWGGVRKGDEGLVYIIPGLGVSPEMTAMFDCIRLDLAKREASIKYKQVRDGKDTWVSAGRIGTLLDAAKNGDKKKFAPFKRLLEDYEHG